MKRGLLAAVVTVAVTVVAGAQAKPGEQAPSGTPNGMIVGQVVDATTGAPMSEAIVSLTMRWLTGAPPPTMTSQARVMADGEGRFFFSELAAGDFFLTARKEGYTPGSYQQRQPWGPSGPLSLAQGERRADVTLRVWKYGVIAGTVVDEAGEPVVGTTVRALIKDIIAGRPRFGNRQVIPELVPAATTDDRGRFRLPQIVPGSYVVFVPSTHTTVPAKAVEGTNNALRSELFWAGVSEITPLGSPRTQQFGDFALMTLNRVLIPPPPTPDGRMQVYRTTFFPAATSAASATLVAVRAGEEREDITIALRPVPAVRISGRLVTPDGSPAPSMTLRLTGEAMADVTTATGSAGSVGLETATALSDSSGRFTILGVPPGDYTLRHGNAFLSRALQDDGPPAYWLAHPLTVGPQDVSDLVVQLRPAFRVEGRFEFRGGSDAPPQPRAAIFFETPFGEAGGFSGESRDNTFATLGAGGQYIARPARLGPANAWTLQSVTLDGKDITDRVFDLQSDVTSLVVTFTDRPTKVSGTVTDERGNVSATAMVLVYPTDPQQWVGYGMQSRTLRSVTTTDAGVYTFDHLPPGDYYVIAVDAAAADGWQDPATLEALAGRATRLSVESGSGPRTLDLRVRAIR